MKLAITGGTGFVGSHLIDAALGAGHQVRALTRREVQPREKARAAVKQSIRLTPGQGNITIEIENRETLGVIEQELRSALG